MNNTKNESSYSLWPLAYPTIIYLIYPHEVLINIWDSYPVVAVICGALVITTSLFILLWPRVSNTLVQLPQHSSHRRRLAFIVLALPLAIFSSTDSFQFSDNRIINQICHNGISSLFQAFRTNELNYNNFYRTIDRDQAFSLVRSSLLQPQQIFSSAKEDNINRFHKGKAGLGQFNVVVIVEESFGSNYVGVLGDKRQLGQCRSGEIHHQSPQPMGLQSLRWLYQLCRVTCIS